MAEYVYNPVQEVETGQNVLLQDSIPCNRGYVIHRNGSGILTLRGIVNNPCAIISDSFSFCLLTFRVFPYICTAIWQNPSGRHINKDAELAFICGYRNLANSNYDAITQWSSSQVLVCIVQFNNTKSAG